MADSQTQEKVREAVAAPTVDDALARLTPELRSIFLAAQQPGFEIISAPDTAAEAVWWEFERYGWLTYRRLATIPTGWLAWRLTPRTLAAFYNKGEE